MLKHNVNSSSTPLLLEKNFTSLNVGPIYSKFLNKYFENCPPDAYLTVCKFKPSNQTHWIKVEETGKADSIIQKCNLDGCTYFGTGLRKERKENGRGEIRDISCVPAIWADIDIKGPAHKLEKLPENVEIVNNLLKEFNLPPTIRVNTGHGLQVYWQFDQPVMVNDSNREAIIEMYKNFHHVFSDLFNKYNYKLDNVSDLARVLRIPNTVNHKDSNNKVNAELIEYKEQRYSLQELQEFINTRRAQKHIIPLTTTKSERQDEKIENEEYPEISAKLLLKRCPFLKHCEDDSRTLSEPEWYAAITILCRTQESPDIIHKLSESYSGYSSKETSKKIKHALKNSKPFTCKGIQEKCGKEHCLDCRFYGVINSPISLGIIPNCEINSNKLPAFPVDTLPKLFRDFIIEANKSFNTPIDYIASALLTLSSGLIGNSKEIELKKDWKEPAILYTALVGQPGMNKSTPIRKCLEILSNLDDETNKNYPEIQERYRLELEKFKIDMKQWRKEQENNPSEAPQAPSLPQRPFQRRTWTSDATVEALAKKLEENPKGIMYIADELDSWFARHDEYKKSSSDRAFWLNSWNGSSHNVDRKSSGSISINNLNINVLGSIQPDKLRFRDKKMDDGMFDRIIFVFSNNFGSPLLSSNSIPEDIANNVNKCFSFLHCYEYSERRTIIHISDEAFKIFQEYYESTNAAIFNSEYDSSLIGFYKKSITYVGRLALILHCLESECEKIQRNCKLMDSTIPTPSYPLTVQPETMKNAVILAQYFLSHSLYIKKMLSKSEKSSKAENLLEWLETKNNYKITPREVKNYNTTKFESSYDAEKALDLLVKAGKGVWCNKGRSKFFIRFDG